MSFIKECGCARDSGLWCASVETLWQGFEKHRGLDGYDLCKRLGLTISRSRTMKRFQALLRRERGELDDVYFVILPTIDPTDASAREELLIHHEVAHFLLKREHRFWDETFRPRNEIAVAVETWCDNFALAMLFAFFGIMVMDRTNAHAFLRANERFAGMAERDKALGERMLGLCRKPPETEVSGTEAVPGACPEPLPLFRLSEMLAVEVRRGDD